ncbi:hypothetical protein [Bradyrhizobium sp. S3.2.12]|uniref:hypothetical protein n=1 Tax=unclassified Bradyrhizobium TaxID=2631580 RepID=UPI003392E212
MPNLVVGLASGWREPAGLRVADGRLLIERAQCDHDGCHRDGCVQRGQQARVSQHGEFGGGDGKVCNGDINKELAAFRLPSYECAMPEISDAKLNHLASRFAMQLLNHVVLPASNWEHPSEPRVVNPRQAV